MNWKNNIEIEEKGGTAGGGANHFVSALVKGDKFTLFIYFFHLKHLYPAFTLKQLTKNPKMQ